MKTDQQMIRWALEESPEPIIKNPYLRVALRGNFPPSMQTGVLPIEFDQLSPQEQQYYQNPPFSTHPDFLGAKGGSAQLVQPGPGRQGYADKKKPNLANPRKVTAKYHPHYNEWKYLWHGKKGAPQKPVYAKSKTDIDKKIKSLQKIALEKQAAGAKAQNLPLQTFRKNIDSWTTNYFKNNIDKYKVKNGNQFLNNMKKDWAAELKANPTKYSSKSLTFKPSYEGLPNINPVEKRIGEKIIKVPEGAFSIYDNKLAFKQVIPSYLRKSFYRNKLQNPELQQKVFRFMNHYLKGAAGINQFTKKAYDKLTAEIADPDVLHLLSAKDSGVTGHAKNDLFEPIFKETYTDYIAKTRKMSDNYLRQVKIIEDYLGPKYKGYIEKTSKADRAALAKIFNVKELPDSLKYSQDHLFGLSEAARSIKSGKPDKTFVKSVLDNMLGMTRKKNAAMGTEWYSFQRKNLATKIEKGIDVKNNLQQLNELTESGYDVKNAYRVKDGKVRPTKAFTGVPQTERFAGYFRELVQTPEGRIQLKKQSTSRVLSKFLKDNNIRICKRQFQTGKSVLCGDDLARAEPEEFIKAVKADKNAVKLLTTGQKFKNALRGLSVWAKGELGPFGWIGSMATIDAGLTLAAKAEGKDWLEALDEGVLWFLPRQVLKAEEKALMSRAGGLSDQQKESMRIYFKLEDVDKKWADNEMNLQYGEEEGPVTITTPWGDTLEEEGTGVSKQQSYETMREHLARANNKLITDLKRNEGTLDTGKVLEETYQNVWDTRGRRALDMINESKDTYLDILTAQSGKTGLGKTAQKDIFGDKAGVLTSAFSNPAAYLRATSTLPGLGMSREEKEQIARDAGREDLLYKEYMHPQYGPSLSLDQWMKVYPEQFGGYAGGGIAGIRRPWAIPPESGPDPYGGGLSSQFNRVKKLTG